MATGKDDIREDASETKASADVTNVEAGELKQEAAAPVAAATIEMDKADEPITEAIAQPALPPAAQLAEPLPAIETPVAAPSPVAEPPPFLREHETRTVPVKPAPRRKAAEAKSAAGVKEKSKAGRFPLLAASMALAAALGAAAGAFAVPGFLQIPSGPASAAPASDSAIEILALKTMVAQLSTDLGAVRANLEQAGKVTTAHYSKIAERLDRAQTEPAAKLAKVIEALDRLERRTAAAPAPQVPAQDITGAAAAPHPPAAEAKPKATILDDYILRKVYDGVALVEGRRTGIIEVEPGSNLPGAGRVEEIRRQDGRWVVVTAKGLIVSAR